MKGRNLRDTTATNTWRTEHARSGRGGERRAVEITGNVSLSGALIFCRILSRFRGVNKIVAAGRFFRKVSRRA
jgi:hypothetical protein